MGLIAIGCKQGPVVEDPRFADATTEAARDGVRLPGMSTGANGTLPHGPRVGVTAREVVAALSGGRLAREDARLRRCGDSIMRVREGLGCSLAAR